MVEPAPRADTHPCDLYEALERVGEGEVGNVHVRVLFFGGSVVVCRGVLYQVLRLTAREAVVRWKRHMHIRTDLP